VRDEREQDDKKGKEKAEEIKKHKRMNQKTAQKHDVPIPPVYLSLGQYPVYLVSDRLRRKKNLAPPAVRANKVSGVSSNPPATRARSEVRIG
jgi:hypothetical protein